MLTLDSIRFSERPQSFWQQACLAEMQMIALPSTSIARGGNEKQELSFAFCQLS
jgi:hypothetical protein